MLTLPASAQPSKRFEHSFRSMGVQFQLVAYASSLAEVRQAFGQAQTRAEELDQIFSDYKTDSESRRLVERPPGVPSEVSPDLYWLISESQRKSVESQGAFDITIGPVVRLWRLARKRHRLPDAEELQEAMRCVGSEKILLGEPHRVTLAVKGSRLDFGGIAKGYAADECLKILIEAGLPASMVDASGNLALGDPPPGQTGWKVAIASFGEPNRTEQSLELSRCGVSTSSDAQQATEIDGRRYSHIIDPRTGQALTESHSITVIARNAMDADAWSTALSVLGPEHIPDFRAKHADVQIILQSR